MAEEMMENVEAAATEETAGAPEDNGADEVNARKYSDADVDRIVAKKIAAERKKMAKLFAEGQESELEKRERNVLERELRLEAREALDADGIPLSLMEIMRFDSREAYEKSLGAVRSARTELARTYLSGPIPKVSTGSMKEIDREKRLHDAFHDKAR